MGPWRNPGGTLVQPWWNLTSGPPRTTPEPIWAETPKLSAVGEQSKNKSTPILIRHPFCGLFAETQNWAWGRLQDTTANSVLGSKTWCCHLDGEPPQPRGPCQTGCKDPILRIHLIHPFFQHSGRGGFERLASSRAGPLCTSFVRKRVNGKRHTYSKYPPHSFQTMMFTIGWKGTWLWVKKKVPKMAPL